MRARHLQLLAGITLAGALLRFATLDVQSYWLDEVATANILGHGFGGMISAVASGESTPPLYYIVAWLWSKLFGTGEVGLRSLSALFGALTIPLAFVLGRELVGRRTGLVAAALVAFNPLLVWYSQEARSYALMVLLTGLSLLAMLRVLERPSARRLAAWATVSVAAIATHYFAGFLVGAEALWLLYRAAPRRQVTAAVLAVAAAAAALLPLALHQRSTGAARFISESSLVRRIAEIPKQFAVGYQGPLETPTTIVAMLLLAYAVVRLAAAPSRARGRAVALAASGFATIAAPLALALVGPDYLLSRNMLAAWLPLGLAASTGFASHHAPRRGVAAAGLLCALGLLMVVAVDIEPRYQRDDWRGAVRALGTSGQARAIIVTPPSGRIPLMFYLRDGARPVVPPGVDVRELDMVGMAPRLPGQPPAPPRPPVIAINQLSEFARTQAETFTVVREGSATRQHIEATTSASPLDGRPGVMIYQPASR